MNKKYYGKLKKTSEQMIIRDGQTISSVMLTAPCRPVVSLLLMPYAGLYCKEAEEFYGRKVVDSTIDSQITDLRNSIKIFCDRYGRAEKAFLQSDFEQDEYFKNLLRFDFTKTMNIHYNLGIYFNHEGHVIGDTQLINFHLNEIKMGDPEVNEKSFLLGNAVGVSVSRILMLAKQKPKNRRINSDIDFSIGYIDCNSNSDNAPFVYPYKSLNLFLLHMLGMLGTCKYVVRKILGDHDQWGYRCEYVIYHNIWTGLRIIEAHIQQDKTVDIETASLLKLVDEGRIYFRSSFRNCMMHYDLVKNEEPCILEEYYKPDIPFYGLVESCFDGMSAGEYYAKLRDYMDSVETYLNGWFTLDFDKICWDL